MLRTASILEQVINPQVGNLMPEVAQYLLSLDFPPAVHARYAELSEKAQEGMLSPAERNELDDILVADAVLSIVQSKARISLKNNKPAA